jgi:hypothetical protein
VGGFPLFTSGTDSAVHSSWTGRSAAGSIWLADRLTNWLTIGFYGCHFI